MNGALQGMKTTVALRQNARACNSRAPRTVCLVKLIPIATKHAREHLLGIFERPSGMLHKGKALALPRVKVQRELVSILSFFIMAVSFRQATSQISKFSRVLRFRSPSVSIPACWPVPSCRVFWIKIPSGDPHSAQSNPPPCGSS